MTATAPSSKSVFRACVVEAVRGGEKLIQSLLAAALADLQAQEQAQRNAAQRSQLSLALQLLGQHDAALRKSFVQEMLVRVAQTPTAAKAQRAAHAEIDINALSLVDDDAMQAQIEFAKAHQIAVHATGDALGTLDKLICAAQGLRSVQTERNPLRPDNYLRSLQHAVAQTGVSAEVRALWMPPMYAGLGPLLVAEYTTATSNLRKHGIRPVAYAVAGGAGALGGDAGGAFGHSHPASSLHAAAYGQRAAASRPASLYGDDLGPEDAAQEDLLTAALLREMLLLGDPFAGFAAPGAVGYPVGMMPETVVVEHISEVGPLLSRTTHPGALAQGVPGAVRHAGGGGVGYPVAMGRHVVGGYAAGSYGAAPVHSGNFVVGAPDPAMQQFAAMDLLASMLEHMVNDERLPPAVHEALRRLEPALIQLVKKDPTFFDNEQHPARRLLDDITQRSLGYGDDATEGFGDFFSVLYDAVDRLVAQTEPAAAAFASAHQALIAAWDALAKRMAAAQEAKRVAAQWAAHKADLVARLRALPGAQKAPPELMQFLTGIWVDVIVQAQLDAARATGTEAKEREGLADSYAALVPELLWVADPAVASQDGARLAARSTRLLEMLRKGLARTGVSSEPAKAEAQAFLMQVQDWLATAGDLAALHDTQLQSIQQHPQDDAPVSPETATGPTDFAPSGLSTAPAPLTGELQRMMAVGAWVELVSGGRVVRTQLSWASPQGTLFMFRAADASTQSMTRRMLDKLLAEGALRASPRQG